MVKVLGWESYFVGLLRRIVEKKEIWCYVPDGLGQEFICLSFGGSDDGRMCSAGGGYRPSGGFV